MTTLPRLLGVQYECPTDSAGTSRSPRLARASMGVKISWTSHAGASVVDRMWAIASPPLLANFPLRCNNHCSNHFGFVRSARPTYPGASFHTVHTIG